MRIRPFGPAACIVLVLVMLLPCVASAVVLYSTGDMVAQRGWPVFGSSSSMVEWGQPYTAGLAIPVTVPVEWLVDSMYVGAFGPVIVTGDPTPQELVVSVYPDGGGVPGPVPVQSYPLSGVSGMSSYVVQSGGLSLPPGTYWIAMLPSSPTTRAGWGQGASLGRVAKTTDGGSTWGQFGSPFDDVPVPSLRILGRTSPGPGVLYTTGPMALERGWPVFGSSSSTAEWGQPYTAGPAIPFTAPVEWLVDFLQVGAFGPAIVTGDPAPQDLLVSVYPDAGGVPGSVPVQSYPLSGVSALATYSISAGGLPLPPGRYWIAVLPSSPATRAGWGQGTSLGRVAKTTDGGSTWGQFDSPFNDVSVPSLSIVGRVGPGPTVLYTTGPMAEQRGWPVFGSSSSTAEWGQPYEAGPAIPFTAPVRWLVDFLQVGAFGPAIVTGDPTPQDLVVSVYPDAGGVPSSVPVATFAHGGVSGIGTYTVPTGGLPLPAGAYWIAVLPPSPTTRAGWARSASLGRVAKTTDGGLTWGQFGSPFSDVSVPSLSILGRTADTPLYTTGPMALERGWPVFGSISSTAEWGQPYTAGPAIPFTVPVEWLVDFLEIGAFGPAIVTGDPTPQHLVVSVYPDAGGVPGPVPVQSFPLSGVSASGTYGVPAGGLSLSPGTYWIAVLPASAATRAGWGQGTSLGRVAKTTDGGSTWGQFGSPFDDVAVPSLSIFGRPVLYTTGPVAEQRGWPVFGSSSSTAEWGQPYTAGPAIPFTAPVQWLVDFLEVGAFGPAIVTGDPTPQDLVVSVYPDAGGVPSSVPVATFAHGGVSGIGTYTVPTGGLPLPAGAYWIAVLPSSPTTRAGWARSASLGRVAKTTDGGSTWGQFGSPFADVPVPSLSIIGRVSSVPVLFSTGSMVMDRGWPVFGPSSSLTEWGQPYTAGPAIPFTASIPWVIESFEVSAFGPSIVTGDPTLQHMTVSLRRDAGGVPSRDVLSIYSLSGVSGTETYRVAAGGQTLWAGAYWISVLPATSDTRAAWGHSAQIGRVAKTTDGGLTWQQFGSPFENVSVPAVSILGQIVTAVDEGSGGDGAPRLVLRPAVPNPATRSSKLAYVLPVTGHATLAVYDVSGARVITLVSEVQEAGDHTASWDGRNSAGARVASGLYWARLRTSAGVRSTRIVWLE